MTFFKKDKKHPDMTKMLPMTYGYGSSVDWMDDWSDYEHVKFIPRTEKDFESFEFLRDYSKVFNFYTASSVQPNPYSNKAMFIIDILSKIGIKFRVDVFPYGYATDSHRLINIIAEPNPEVKGPALVFCAHHDVMNVRSENCQDNGASVCNLLRLVSLIHQSPQESQRTVVLFSDCEESGARGAKQFCDKAKYDKATRLITHPVFGEISAVVNLELTGLGKNIWSDCGNNQNDIELHKKLEKINKKSISKFNTPPSDVIAFRNKQFPALCIGTLPDSDLKDKTTWRLCHSMEDTFEKCSREDMQEFTTFLHNLTKIEQPVLETKDQLTLELN